MVHTVALTLIRHGATINNERNVYQGWLNSPLLPSEVDRLRRIKHQYPKPHYVISSDLTRCLETAKLLFSHHEIEMSENFREFHFGDFEGKTYEQLKDDKTYQKWLEDPFLHRPPNGESIKMFTKRIQDGWDGLHSKFLDGVREITVVSHSGVIRHLLEMYAPHKKTFWDWIIPFGGGYRLVTTREKLGRGERCISLSEVPLTENENG